MRNSHVPNPRSSTRPVGKVAALLRRTVNRDSAPQRPGSCRRTDRASIRRLAAALAATALEVFASSSHASVTAIFTPTPGNTLIDFESTLVGVFASPLTVGTAQFSASTPLAIGDITGFGADGTEVFHHVLRSNGSQSVGSPGYVDIRIDFSTPMAEVGMGWWDANLLGNALEAYDANNVLLLSVPIPTNPPGGGFAEFRGIKSTQNEISYVITHSMSTDVYAIDNISFHALAVPEPSSVMLAGVALTALGWITRRRPATAPAR